MVSPLNLPPLPFGRATAKSFDHVRTCGDFLARLPDAPSQFDAIGPGRDFRIKLRPVPIPEVTLLAGASSPKTTSHVSDRLAVVIPFGTCTTVLRAAGRRYDWASPHHAFFIPAGERVAAESTTGAFLRFDIRESALRRTAAGMLGSRQGTLSLDTHTTRTLSMHAPGVNWLPVIRGLCATIDAFDCDAARLVAAGIDDVILRTVVMMLTPELALDDRLAGPPSRALDLEPLLERIRATIGGRVTLADMEAWSGRSARTIQLAFQTLLGVGPMQWLRDQRLDLIRDRLLGAPEGATVAEIAKGCGMHRMATLTAEYAKRFGELPSETLARRRR
ncbi:MAG: helix-turn-helix domain-containing protein [Planctomycetia bacterium]